MLFNRQMMMSQVHFLLERLAWKSILKKVAIALAVVIILAAVISSLFRSLTPWAKQYKGEVEQQLSKLLAQPVKVQSMETGWYWLQPVVKLSQVTINPGAKTAIHLDKLFIGINLLQSLLHWKVQTGMLYVDNVHLVLREGHGQWHVQGLASQPSSNQADNAQRALVWLANQGSLIVRQASMQLYFKDGSIVPVGGINFSVVNNGGYYKLKGEAKLLQTNASTFQLVGRVRFNPYRLKNTNGHVYVGAKNIALAQWQMFLSALPQHIEGGTGDIALWVDLKDGGLAAMQSQLQLQHVAWLTPSKKRQLVQSLSANIDWKRNPKGWRLQADHMQLLVGGIHWPENQLSVTFDKEQNATRLFLKTIILESLLPLRLDWPPSVQTLQQHQVHGLLSDTQLVMKGMQPTYLLTRFDNLGWTAPNNTLAVNNLTGALHWQPQEGRLELDSDHSSLTVKGYPTQQINVLNGALEWKQLSDGLRLSLDRFVLSEPQLTLTAEGTVAGASSQTLGQIGLQAEFSGNNIEQWIAYIPQRYVRPKLYEWLTHGLTHIAKASGKVIVNGLAKDFPFDNNTGEFSIVSHAVGLDLSISPQWQLIKDVEAFIRMKNRNLDIDIVNADLQGVPAQQINIRIDDIGKGKEELLLQGHLKASAQKILDFVMHSPLQNKLTLLKNLNLKGLLGLDLQLQLPLYAENKEVLAKGDVKFKNNTLLMQYPKMRLAVEDVTGDLQFNEKGITDSVLSASAYGYPLSVVMQTVSNPTPHLEIAVDGECHVDSLKKQSNAPLLSLLKGSFPVKALFKVSNDPKDFNSLEIHSSLKGLAINLPAPLGKQHGMEEPLDVIVDFNTTKELRVKTNYNNHLSADLLLKEKQGVLALESGQIKLGSAPASVQTLPGVDVVGNLAEFDLKAWSTMLAQMDKASSQVDWLSYLRLINVSLGKLTLFKQQFDNMSINAKRLQDKRWSLQLKQKNIAGEVVYQPKTNAISGHLAYLHLQPFKQTKEINPLEPPLAPSKIPNLNLRIDSVSLGTKALGSITLKSESSRNKWLINYCRIESPEYQMDIEGDWMQQDKSNKTKVKLTLSIKDLAKSLELWNITPVVDASKGEMVFEGGWDASMFDFSLGTIHGNMQLQLKNGRITHLSPDTEEKLGLGKLLSVLSLQTIPRRLKLDFSDLSNQGYSFDVFQGGFTLAKGIMSTQDSYIDGPVAYASMKGDLDLVKRLYDLDLKISPHITASLPIVATIAGGPIAGVAAWVASKIINKGMQKISGYSYKITGPWNQPVVQQLKIMKARP